MQEYEAKFIGIDTNALRTKLLSLGFENTKPETMMKRKVFHIDGNSKKWGRVRDEGDKITLTIKEIVKEDDINGVKEAEVIVNNFESAVHLLEMSGFYAVSYQETKREAWQKNNVEVVIDTWPGLEPFIEVEAPSVEIVKQACVEIELNIADAMFGGVDVIYQKELGIMPDIINNLPEISFSKLPSS